MTTYTGRDFWESVGCRWQTAPLRQIATLGTGHTPSRNQTEYWEHCTIPWVTTEDLTRRVDSDLAPLMDTRQKISELGLANSAAVLHPTDTVMLSRTASVGHVVRIGKPMATTQAFVTWACGDAIDPRFLVLALKAMAPEFQRIAYGSTHLTIYMPDIEQLRVPVPPLAEQHAIADYLDTETARIDALIAKKQQLRSSLRERYAAVVRKELAHHEGIKLKHLLAAPLAYGVLVPVHDPEGVPMLRITDLRRGTVDLASVTRIPESLSVEYRRTVLRLGDLVVSVVGTLGRSIVVSEELVGANLNRALARVQLRSTVPRSLVRLWFESEDFQLQARLATSGDSAQPTLGLGDMKNFKIGIPADSSTWPDIANRTVRRLTPIEEAITRLAEQERLLSEHRQSLITAAVTGEFEIPGAA